MKQPVTRYKHKSLLFFVLCMLHLPLMCQDKTIGSSTGTPAPVAAGKHKIMIVPFENRMYLSEIDFQINKESNLSGKQIKALMRDGINEQLYKKLKPQMGVVDLLDDTVKTRKDLGDIYRYLTYQYQKVPSQEQYKAPEKEKQQKAIEKGQLNVESNDDARFMNAKIKNATLVPYLYGKYKTDLFLFINELDIKALSGAATGMNTEASRRIVLHYTVYTYDAREINSGIAEVALPTQVNNPHKIVNTYLAQLAGIVAERIQKAAVSVK